MLRLKKESEDHLRRHETILRRKPDMFTTTSAFSGFSVDDVPAAKGFTVRLWD